MNLGDSITEEDIAGQDGSLIGKRYTLWHCGKIVREWSDMLPEPEKKEQKMNGTEFYKRLQPAYAKWLDSMDKTDAINNAAEIAFVKEVMFLLDELADDVKIDDSMDPAWFMDECVEAQRTSDNWFDVFNGTEYLRAFVEDENRVWKQYSKDRRNGRDS